VSVPSSELGLPMHPLSSKRVCPPPPRNQRRGTHSPAGEGVPIRTTREKMPRTLSPLWSLVLASPIFDVSFFKCIIGDYRDFIRHSLKQCIKYRLTQNDGCQCRKDTRDSSTSFLKHLGLMDKAHSTPIWNMVVVPVRHPL
jgi:hypothetical protein